MDKIGTREIADMLGLKRTYVTDKLTKRPDFPKPVIAATQKTKLWKRSDVDRWMRRNITEAA